MNTHLARILAGITKKPFLSEYMLSKTGKEVNTIKDKLKVFSDYYEELYTCFEPTEEEIDTFLNKVEFP